MSDPNVQVLDHTGSPSAEQVAAIERADPRLHAVFPMSDQVPALAGVVEGASGRETFGKQGFCMHPRRRPAESKLAVVLRSSRLACATPPPRSPRLACEAGGYGGFAYACFDEEHWELDVWFLAKLEPQLWYRRSLEAPSFFAGARLAIAGKAVAVAFSGGGVWVTRDIEHHHFKELAELRVELPPPSFGEPAIAFEGATADAPLLAAVAGSRTSLHITRVDAGGRVTRIAEVATEGEGEVTPSVRGLVWDPTRRALWSAAGQAGIICTTAPDVPWPLGVSAVS